MQMTTPSSQSKINLQTPRDISATFRVTAHALQLRRDVTDELLVYTASQPATFTLTLRDRWRGVVSHGCHVHARKQVEECACVASRSTYEGWKIIFSSRKIAKKARSWARCSEIFLWAPICSIFAIFNNLPSTEQAAKTRPKQNKSFSSIFHRF